LLKNCKKSIQNAYCEIIRNSEHFVYIENQFFITATGDKQKPVKNQIGAAIVERILRAARNGERYKMMVMMPAVPAFAGDLKADDALGTRAIMEFQYNSISRGGHSIYEEIARANVNPMDYLRFYNLRNYDRINASGVMAQVEQQTGVSYEDARKQHDAQYGGLYAEPAPPQYQQQGGDGYQQQYSNSSYDQPQTGGYGQQQGGGGYDQPPPQQYQPYHPQAGSDQGTQQSYSAYRPQPQAYEMDASGSRGVGDQPRYEQRDPYQQYQQGAQQIQDRKGLASGRWDSVAECYMLHGEDIRNVPWEGGNMDEIDAFVSEELYIHSKVSYAIIVYWQHC
jgi:phospholipase D1/2